MTHGSLFSGIGGFDLAAEEMGWENIFHCEIEPFNQRILKYHFPKSISYADIKQADFTIHRGQIDILTGGFPCQPFSQAGKRKGTEDDRHLWPEMLRAIQEIKPRYIVGENVYGIVNWSGGLVFDEVQSDLEDEGYEVQPVILPAVSVNAPHRRDRVWFVAYCNEKPRKQETEREWRECIKEGREIRDNDNSNGGGGTTPHPSKFGRHNGSDNRQKRHIQGDEGIAPKSEPEREGRECRACEIGSITPHTNRNGQQRSNGEHEKHTSERGEYAQCDTQQGIRYGATADTNGRRQSSKEHREKETGWSTKEGLPGDWKNFPTQPPVCSGDDGLPTELDGITFPKWRNESIKSYGNAIVPQVVLQIFKAIQEFENSKTCTDTKQ